VIPRQNGRTTVNRIFTAIKRLFLAMSLVLVYLIGKELVLLNRLLFAVHPLLGYGFLLCTGLFVVWFILLPLLKIITLPNFPDPQNNPLRKVW
jgi:hypothetical protein